MRGLGHSYGRLQLAVENASHIVHGSEVGQERTEIRQFGVVRVVEPGRDGNGIVRMEDVRSRRVVYDDAGMNFSSELRQVLEYVQYQRHNSEGIWPKCLP